MSEDPTPVTLNTASEILEFGVEIANVQFFRLQAEVKEDVSAEEVVPAEIEPAYGLKLRHEGTEFGIRMSVTLDLAAAKIIVDAAVNYTTAEVVTLGDGALLDFANNVGVMALLPYLRQAIADLSQRVLGEIVLMPIIRRGTLLFTVDDGSEG